MTSVSTRHVPCIATAGCNKCEHDLCPSQTCYSRLQASILQGVEESRTDGLIVFSSAPLTGEIERSSAFPPWAISMTILKRPVNQLICFAGPIVLAEDAAKRFGNLAFSLSFFFFFFFAFCTS